MNSYQSGDVVFRTAELSSKSANATISILPQMQGCDIWEDMAKPTIYATVYLYDAINLLTRFPIIGEETLTLSFETPGMALPVTYKFRVFEIANIQQADNRQAVGYTIRCVSEEHFVNGTATVDGVFNGVLSDYVVSLLAKSLKSTKSIVIDQTKGVLNVVSPRWNPLIAIDYARKNAVSTKYPSSSYVFFENQAGFYFKTVESLLEEGRSTVGSRVFTFLYAPSAASSSAGYRSILEHENISRVDSISSVTSGMLSAVAHTFDLKNKTLTAKPFSITKEFGKYQTPDDNQSMIHSKQFLDTYGQSSPVTLYNVKDSFRPTAYQEEVSASRNAFTMLLNGNITRCLIHGDSGLKAGDVITLNLPEVIGVTGKKPLDPMVAGNYMILRLRHVLTNGPKPQHRISFDAAKIGFKI